MSPPPRPAPFSTHTRRGAVADRNSGQGTHSRADAGSEPRSIITTSTCTSGHPSPEARLGNRALDHRGTRTERNNFLEVLVMMDCPHLASVIRERELRVRPLPWIELLATAEHHAVPVLARPLSPLTRRRWSRRRHPLSRRVFTSSRLGHPHEAARSSSRSSSTSARTSTLPTTYP